MPTIPNNIKILTPRQDRITYECIICGSYATFTYPVDMEKNKWWFEKHEKCPEPDNEEIYKP